MLTGHIAAALGAHGLRSAVPLWLLVIASQLPDWSDAALCLGGLRSSTPGLYSHALLPVAVLAGVAAAAFFVWRRDAGGSLVIAAVVITHLLGDYVTGLKPTWEGGPVIGLNLYAKPALDFIFEAAVLATGWLLYQRSFPAARRYSREVVLVLISLLLIQAAADIAIYVSPGMSKC
ncbi:MAG: hypothetical protein ACSLFK_13305 [Gemmatimonadaceae bacterium]